MDRWENRVAVVTGASSGIGAAVAADLIRAGLIVVALARRIDRLRENQASLQVELQPKYHPVECDVTNEENVNRVFKWIDEELGGTDILINNAGCVRISNLSQENNTDHVHTILNTNVLGVIYCTRAAFASMKRRKFDGHIVLTNSIAGHVVPKLPPGVPPINIYSASKFAITAMTEIYRQEFLNADTKIKITSISPGACDTEIISAPTKDALKKMSGMLNPEDISNAILYALRTPPHVQIYELTIKPVGELF